MKLCLAYQHRKNEERYIILKVDRDKSFKLVVVVILIINFLIKYILLLKKWNNKEKLSKKYIDIKFKL